MEPGRLGMSARIFVEPSHASPGQWVVGEFLSNGWYRSHGRHKTRQDAERVGTEIAEALGICPPLIDGKAHCPDCSGIQDNGGIA